MHNILVNFPLHGLAFLAWCVLPNYAVTFFNGNSKELMPYIRIRCGFLDCPYGYETDVEGNPICQCHDPCKYVYCLNDTKCVVRVPKSCHRNNCKEKPEGVCQDVGKKRRKKINLYTTPLSDDAFASAKSSSTSPKCYLPLTEEAKDCRKMRKRWYYDPDTGKCIKFRGCKTEGNNFGRKKRCKRKCIRRRKFPKRKARRLSRVRIIRRQGGKQ